MNQAILIHGWANKSEFYDAKYPTASNSHWFPWLSKQLMIRDFHTIALEMPQGYYPKYDIWKRELERFDITEDTVLVGHSCGGGFLVRWLSENNVKVGKVVLVAPWLGIHPGVDLAPEIFDESFFDFTIERDIIDKTKGITIIHSTNDHDPIQKSVKKLRSQLKGIKYVELENKGHFTLNGLDTEEFPELLQEIMG